MVIRQQKFNRSADAPTVIGFEIPQVHTGMFAKRRQFRKRGQIANNSVSADDPDSDVTIMDKLEDPASEILDKLWETQWEENLLDVAKTRVKRRVEPRLFQIYDLSVRKEWPPAKVAAALEVPIAQVYLAKHRVADFIMEELRRIEKSVI